MVKQDLDQVEKKGPIELILDGKIIIANLSYIHTQDWVEKQCQAHNINVEQVSYAVVGTNDVFYLLSKKE